MPIIDKNAIYLHISKYIFKMINANNEPDFLTIWKSLKTKKKTSLKGEFTKAAGTNGESIADITFFRKKAAGEWNEMEKEWWATKLNLPKDQLFPNQ